MSQINALIVDDSSTSRMLLTNILRKMDIHCEQASSGENAITQLAQTKPDFIFLDHLMPGMDGFQTLAEIKKSPDTKHIPVIMYTSQHAEKYYEEAHALGAVGVISKQIDREKLYLMINSLCLENKHAKDIPSVYEEIQSSLEDSVNKLSPGIISASISTLESAYEELHDENRQLKIELSDLNSDQDVALQRIHQGAIFQKTLALSLCLFIALLTYLWSDLDQTKNTLAKTQLNLSVTNELINEMINILEPETQ